MATKNFAVIGVAGYIAPRHLKAIRDNGHRVIAALDPNDSVGILDQFHYQIKFFTEFERFDRHAEKLRRLNAEDRIHFVSICSPNYLHDAHIRFALRIGADAICEKPLVLNPWNVDALEVNEKESGKKVYTVLQLRVHPTIIELKNRLKLSPGKKKIDLCYITARGYWYQTSWKGQIEKSGGIASNIGIHFFDMLLWIFGSVTHTELHLNQPDKMAGYFELEFASVRWFLSIDPDDLPKLSKEKNLNSFRQLSIDGTEIEFSDGFTDLHTLVYKDILNGNGYGLKDAKPAIELINKIRNQEINPNSKNRHKNLIN